MHYVPRVLFASSARRRSTIGGLCAATLAVAVVVAGPDGASQAATTPNVDAAYGAQGVTTVAGDPSGTAVDGAGRTLLATEDGSGVARLTRLTAAGARDASFGTGGAVTLPYAGALALHADGSASVVTVGEDQKSIRVHRVSGAGATLASSTPLTGRTVQLIVSVAARADGVLIVHAIDQDASPTKHLLTAVRPNGTLDTSWGAGGVLALQDDNHVYAIAATGNSLVALTQAGVRRYNAAGGVDSSLATTALPAGFEPQSISVSGGAYYLNGRARATTQRMAVVKVLPTGARDTSFGSGGMATGSVHDCTPTARLSFATSAGVYLIGHNGDCGASRVYVHRFTPAGASDSGFGAAGEVVVDEVRAQRSLGGSGGGAQPDGKVLVAFRSANGTTSVVRLLPAAATTPAPYVPVSSSRVLAPVRMGAQKSVTLTVKGTGVAAVALDVAVARGRAAGGVLAYPAGGKVPAVTTHVHLTGQSVTQRLVVPVGAGGRVILRNASSGAAHLAANLVGYYRTGPYVPVQPTRVLNARGLGAGKAAVFAVAGRAGVPTSGVNSVLVNVSVNGVSRAGSLKLYATGASVPASVLASHGAKLPGNASIRVSLGTGGRLTVLNNAATSGNVTVDVVGYLKS